MNNDTLFKVLHELADMIEVFSHGICRYNYGPTRYLSPLTVFIIFISLTIIAAYSSNDTARIIVIGICAVQLLLIGSRRILTNILKTYMFIIFLAAFLGLPSIYLYTDKYSVVASMTRTIFVSLSSSTPMIVFSILVGLREIGEIISIFSRALGRAIYTFSTILLKISRLQIDILLMRFSRNIINKRGYIWIILTSSIGDTLLHSEYISQNIALAMKSRTLASKSLRNEYTLKLLDYIVIIAILSMVFIAILVLK